MARNRRITVTLSYPMEVALDSVSARTGLHPSTLAMGMLRQGLDAEMRLPAVVDAVAEHIARRTVAEWRQETGDETVSEVAYRAVKKAAAGEGVRGDGDQARGATVAPVAAQAKGRGRTANAMAGKEQVR